MIYFLIFACVLLLSYVLFFPSLILSYTTGAIDYPTSRKTHILPTARAGGFSLYIAFSAFLLISSVNNDLKIPLFCGSTVIFLVGLFDDARHLTPFQKLAGQFSAAAAYIMISGGDNLAENVLTLAWILYLSNAINLTDGLNGLAGGVCSGEALCLAVLALIFGNTDVFLCSIMLLGAIIGFLPHNFPRAKIFMGDCGALFLGFTLATLSSKLVFESESILCLLSTMLVFRLPTYDTNLSIIRRILKGKNPFKADKGHFHHRLLEHGFSKECAALALVTASLFLGLIGILISTL